MLFLYIFGQARALKQSQLQTRQLGQFAAELAAAQAYDAAGKMLDGKFFPGNFRDEGDLSGGSASASTESDSESSSDMNHSQQPPRVPKWGRVVKTGTGSARKANSQTGGLLSLPDWTQRPVPKLEVPTQILMPHSPLAGPS